MATTDPQTSDDAVSPAGGVGPDGAATAGDDDQTVFVDRKASRADKSNRIPVPAPAPAPASHDEDDHTVVVAKSARSRSTSPHAKAKRKPRIAPPPVPVGFTPEAVKAVGANSTERYRPRAIPAPPSPAPIVVEWAPASRETATMRSVSRHTRLTARVALVAFAASCVASIVGLTLIALALFARR